jgi:hypothetical protein
MELDFGVHAYRLHALEEDEEALEDAIVCPSGCEHMIDWIFDSTSQKLRAIGQFESSKMKGFLAAGALKSG